MDPQGTLFDHRVGPDATNQLVPEDRFASAFAQSDQDFKRAAAEAQRLSILEQDALGGDESKRPEDETLIIHGEAS
jgi:hypothetical protein